jgi:hypothetical protein
MKAAIKRGEKLNKKDETNTTSSLGKARHQVTKMKNCIMVGIYFEGTFDVPQFEGTSFVGDSGN